MTKISGQIQYMIKHLRFKYEHCTEILSCTRQLSSKSNQRSNYWEDRIGSWAASCFFPTSLHQVTGVNDPNFLSYSIETWLDITISGHTHTDSVWSSSHPHPSTREHLSGFTTHCALGFTWRKRWRCNTNKCKGQCSHFSMILISILYFQTIWSQVVSRDTLHPVHDFHKSI